MKENKRNVYAFSILSVLSMSLLIMAQYDCVTFKNIVTMVLPFLLGHTNFWESIIIGIFSSSILVIISSVTNYLTYKALLEKQIKNLYLNFKIEYHKLELNKLERKAVFIEKSEEIWNKSCEYDLAYSPFFTKGKRNTTNKLFHEMLREIMGYCVDYGESGEDKLEELLNPIMLLDAVGKKLKECKGGLDAGFGIDEINESLREQRRVK